MANAIETVLWPGFKAIEPSVRLGGILADKPGYHNMRKRLSSSDYSVGQFAIDRQGPDDEGSAIDLTFPDAQAGNYKTIKKYSNRLYAVRNGDPRTVYMREFFGQIDNDRNVEGWDYSKDRESSSDSSHLWHIHISIHRKYIESEFAMRAILSILKGQSLADWNAENARTVTFEHFNGQIVRLWQGDKDPVLKEIGNAYVARLQRLVEVDDDGIYGPMTAAAVKEKSKVEGAAGNTADVPVWTNLIGMWGAHEVTHHAAEGTTRDPVAVMHFEGAKLPILKYGDSDDAGGIDGSGAHYVRRLQRAVGATVDGDYGPNTAARVRAWNNGQGDGKTVGFEMYRRIYGFLNMVKTGQTVASKR